VPQQPLDRGLQQVLTVLPAAGQGNRRAQEMTAAISDQPFQFLIAQAIPRADPIGTAFHATASSHHPPRTSTAAKR
jgi:hypothetical protein